MQRNNTQQASQHHHQQQQHQNHVLKLYAKQERRQRAQIWLATLLSGVCCAAMAYIINLGIEGIDKLRFKATLHLIQPGGGLLLPWLAFTGSSCAWCMLAGLGVAYLSPLAAGSGIPHIMAYCNGVEIPGLLTLRTLVVKGLGAMCSIGAGLVAGKEGPFIQCGASIAWLLACAAEWTGKRLSIPRQAWQRNRDNHKQQVSLRKQNEVHTRQPQVEEQQQHQQHEMFQEARRRERLRHDAAAMGAGAGVAAAFIAPMAGAAYAVEDIATRYSNVVLGTAFFSGGVMVLFLWMFTAATGGGNLSQVPFTTPLALAFHGTPSATEVRFWWYVWEMPVVVALGLLMGLLGAGWTALNTRLLLARGSYVRHPMLKVSDLLLVCLITNTIRILVAHQSPCALIPPATQLQTLQEQVVSWQFFDAPTGLYPQLWCPEGHYSVYGQLFMLPVEVVVKSLFTLQPGGTLNTPAERQSRQSVSAKLPEQTVFSSGPLAAYMAFALAMLYLTYGVSAPTGIFIPSLVIGATGGRLVGHLLQHTLAARGIAVPVCMPGWSVLGAAGMLVGTTRLTLSNALIVLESSGAVPMSVPMVVLIVAAKLVADSLFPGIYQWQIADAGYPMLEALEGLNAAERAAAVHCQVKDLVRLQQHSAGGQPSDSPQPAQTAAAPPDASLTADIEAGMHAGRSSVSSSGANADTSAPTASAATEGFDASLPAAASTPQDAQQASQLSAAAAAAAGVHVSPEASIDDAHAIMRHLQLSALPVTVTRQNVARDEAVCTEARSNPVSTQGPADSNQQMWRGQQQQQQQLRQRRGGAAGGIEQDRGFPSDILTRQDLRWDAIMEAYKAGVGELQPQHTPAPFSVWDMPST